jgi:hypothetical protein
VVSDQLGCPAPEAVAATFELDHVVGDQDVAPPDELESALTLADPARAQQQRPQAVDLDQRAVCASAL